MGVYTHELSEGLAANDIRVDVYTSGGSVMPQLALPRHHRLLPALGGLLLRQRTMLRDVTNRAQAERRVGSAEQHVARHRATRGPLGRKVRSLLLPLELALHLKRMNYDLIWTQWPVMDGYGPNLWRLLRMLGLPVVHTVHDVLPHEQEDWVWQKRICEKIYESVDALIVHSDFSRCELCQLFPAVAGKVVTSKHGLYTVFRRIPAAREEVRISIGVEPDEIALLFFGSVRPYKNLESIMKAMRHDYPRKVVLVVAGWDYGCHNEDRASRLARTTQRAEELGIMKRVRFIPGPLNFVETARVFEAADVLVQPYLKSHGSGLLLLGMTFQIHIIAARTGGMDEYLAHYPRHTLLSNPECSSVVNGITRAISDLPSGPRPVLPRIPELEWSRIARETLSMLEKL
jgi:glycosyltransferase involved in cell wall biosynthesis